MSLHGEGLFVTVWGNIPSAIMHLFISVWRFFPGRDYAELPFPRVWFHSFIFSSLLLPFGAKHVTGICILIVNFLSFPLTRTKKERSKTNETKFLLLFAHAHTIRMREYFMEPASLECYKCSLNFVRVSTFISWHCRRPYRFNSLLFYFFFWIFLGRKHLSNWILPLWIMSFHIFLIVLFFTWNIPQVLQVLSSLIINVFYCFRTTTTKRQFSIQTKYKRDSFLFQKILFIFKRCYHKHFWQLQYRNYLQSGRDLICNIVWNLWTTKHIRK